jgi:hypothetical protein
MIVALVADKTVIKHSQHSEHAQDTVAPRMTTRRMKVKIIWRGGGRGQLSY